ncbi:MAG: ABC transporter permease subunit [Clostridia bacterium]|nr:ABC transporter permease subunit [Clostridia bacterium]
MWAILKKEFKSYFLSPIGYVVIGIFLFVFSIFFYLTAIQTGSVDLGGLYYNTAFYGLLIIVPILTMRMFAEERKTGTEQLILTSPISMIGVVLGKFFAALGVIVTTLLISFMYFFIVRYFGSPNITVTLVTMLGFILVSAASLSIGMFASSITENQIIAGVITIAFLVLSLFIVNFSEIFTNLSIIDFYQKFPSGVISLTDIIGLVSFTGMFIAFTIIVMQRRKLVK